MEITFESMPRYLGEMFTRLERMEDLLIEQTMPKKTESDLLNITEASEMLNLSVATIYSKVSRGELPYSKRGKKLYFSKTELMEYVKGGKVLTNEEVKQSAVRNAANAMTKGRC